MISLCLLDSNQNMMQPHFRQQLIDALRCDVQVTPLGKSSGDLFIQADNGDVIIFEIKQCPNDLTASIADGRLFEQSSLIPTVARFPFLMLVGELKYQDDWLMAVHSGAGWVKTGWRKESIEMALVRVQANGMIVVQTQTLTDKVRRLIEWTQDADHVPHVQKKRILKSPFETLEQAEQRRKIEFLAQLDGVGTERATNLLEAYPGRTLYELLTLAAIPNDVKIPLWGSKTFEQVQKFLGVQLPLDPITEREAQVKAERKSQLRIEWYEELE